MASQHEKAARPQPFPQLARDTALQRFIETGEDEIAAEDQIEPAIGRRPADVLQCDVDALAKFGRGKTAGQVG